MKKNLVFLLLLIVVLAGCGAAKPTAEKISGSIEDLVAKNKSIRCELNANTSDAMMAGTTFVGNGKVRSDYQTTMPGLGQVNSHMINDGTWVYTWTDGLASQAVKMKVTAMPQADESDISTETQKYGLDNYQAKLDYNCYQWSADQSVFTPPADINFTDYTEMMQSAQKTLDSLNNSDSGDLPSMINTDKDGLCAACDSVPDAAAKLMCKQRLGCQ